MTQCERIVKYCNDFGSITQYEAMKDLGIMRLASRMSDLKRDGYIVTRTYKQVSNRYGEKTSIAEYRVKKPEVEQ